MPKIKFPFAAPTRRADADALKAYVLDWAQQYTLIGRRGADRLQNTPLLELGLALCGEASTQRAKILVCWYLWALVLDDRIDDGPWAENGALDRFVKAVEVEIEPDRDSDPSNKISQLDDPMLTVLANDLWPRTLCAGDDRWGHRLARNLIRHLHAQATFVTMRETETSLTLAQYLPLRRDSFGALFFFDLIDAVESLDPDEDKANIAHWNTLRSLGADIIAWTNDIYSVAKDIICGECFNLVSILAGEADIDLPNAIESAHQMVNESVAEFASIAAWLMDHSRSEATNPDRLGRIVRAMGDWHRSVSRYHLSATETTKQSEQRINLELKPPTLKSRRFEIDPYSLYEGLRTTMPIVYDAPMDAWLVSRYVDVKAALAHPDVNNDNYIWQIGPLLGHTIVSMNGCEHAKHRALLSPAFRNKALKVLEASVVSITADLLARMHGRNQVDLVADFTAQLPVRVMARALGLPAETPEEVALLKDWCAVGFSYMGNYRQDPALLTGGLSNRDSFYEFVQPHIDIRRTKPKNDLISELLAAQIDGQPLPEKFVRAYIAILMTAGSETSHGALANLIVNLLTEPGIRDAVMADPSLMDNAFLETLRRNPPLQLVLREASETLDLTSGTIPSGATLACRLGSANRDPA